MDLSNVVINKENNIRQAIEKIDKNGKKILLVLEDKKLIGVITDGDIRRWILKSGDMSASVEVIMSKSPIVLSKDELSKVKKVMIENSIEAIPIVDKNNEVEDIIFWSDLFYKEVNYDNHEVSVVIMAGGKGTRLKPYTNVIPKGLIPIGDIPIIERIINIFYEYGFKNYYLSLNYKKDIIKAYFNDKKTYNIDFVEEEVPLGTAGSLKLLEKNLGNTFFVSNCDILIDADYSKILQHHKVNKYKITVVAALKSYTIPYGMIKINENGLINGISEKPVYEFLVNTGIYLLEPEILKYVDGELDMTDLISKAIENGEEVGIFPVTENSWLDIGEFSEMKKTIEKLGV